MDDAKSIPALLGGTPVRPLGPPTWPLLDQQIGNALNAAWSDGSWGKYQGGHVERLEKKLREYHGVDFALTCASGTFAVETALRGLGIGSGDEVLVAAYDYSGNFHCVHAVGAFPVLVDVAPNNWNIDPRGLHRALSQKTKALIVSHLHGGLAPMRDLMQFAAEHELAVVEDAAQCPGAIVHGQIAGTWGDVGVLSFGGSKLLTAGRGGAVLTDGDDVHQRMRVNLIRGNHVCPLSELQAAVVLPQLSALDGRNRYRSEKVAYLLSRLADIAGLRPFINSVDACAPAYYKLGFHFDEMEFGLPRDTFVAAMCAEGIAFAEGFRALHVGRSARRFRQGMELKEATKAHHGAVILHHPVLLGDNGALDEVAAAIRKTLAYRHELSQDCR